jgi:hypothetical protein
MPQQIQRISTGYRPHRFQALVHRRLRRFSVVVAHRRFGKTVLAIMELIDRALRDTTGTGRYGYVAPFLKQAKETSWDYLKRFTANMPGRKVHEGELAITLHTGARIRLYGADNAEALRGGYFDFVVVDEVSDMKPEVWGEIIRPMLADRKGGALFIGTPRGQNLLAELFFRDGDGWYRAMFRVDETGLIDDEELVLAREAMSENQFRQEMLCDFSASNDNVLITIDLASTAARRVRTEGDVLDMPVILGVDVARYGGDRSVIIRRQGLQAFVPTVLAGLDNMQVAGHVLTEIAERKPDAVFIDAGRGEGVIDRLRMLGQTVIEVQFGGKASSNAYTNKRSEMWDTMRKWLEDGGAIPNVPDLKTDLCAPTYDLRSGAFALERKEDIKTRLQRSTDLGDALALTFAFPVMPTRLKRTPDYANRQAWDYDPHAAA